MPTNFKNAVLFLLGDSPWRPNSDAAGNRPNERKQHSKHSVSLKSRQISRNFIKLIFRAVELLRTDGRTDGPADCDGRSTGIQ